MRLIDADDLPTLATELRLKNGKTKHFVGVEFDDIRNAPTIEAETVRHGKWVVAGNTTHYYICSVCGKPGDSFDIYCRSCGAKMERPCDKCQEWDCYGCDYKQTEGEEHETTTD